MSAITDTLDRVFDRLLFLPPQPTIPAQFEDIPDEVEVDDAPPATPGERAFSWSLFISATRCTLQYVLLPIVLPVIGLTTDISLPLVILLDLVAITMLVRSLRYFWQTRHPRRFDMLPLSLVILFIVFFSLGFDIWQLIS
ncbi:hypothetical protein [Chloroflexus sp.]|uniref:hypothetical protein n=1 Tax=Chloroflexus sp. TaxID=1904827 RepID=UPI00298EF38A|nr:hypothetical protein [Chloroflexus sp.]MCS6888948.1 hypothetical protein [Chloroflexus sp.]MCX7859474.1 hypothetical protein [Chloroflexus sp.]MDW8402991.1 hypothetical protein [Chloroflexus sp.]